MAIKLFSFFDIETLKQCRPVRKKWKSLIDTNRQVWVNLIKQLIVKHLTKKPNQQNFVLILEHFSKHENLQFLKKIAYFVTKYVVSLNSSPLRFIIKTDALDILTIFEKAPQCYPICNTFGSLHFALENGVTADRMTTR